MSDTESRKKMTIFDIINILVKYRWFIIKTTIVLSVGIFIFVLVTKLMPPDWPINQMPDYYEPKAYVNIQESMSSLSSGASSSSSMLSALMRGGGAAQNPNLELAQVLLEGNTIKDKIIDEFGLIKKDIDEKKRFEARENARLAFSKTFKVVTSKNASSSLFYVLYRDGDSDKATNIMKRTLELLEARFKEVTIGTITQRKIFIEERLKSTEETMKNAQDNLIAFSLRYGVIDISSQAREQTSLLADLSSELLKKEMELKSLLQYMPEDSAKVVLAKKDIETKKELINQLKKGIKGSGVDVLPQNQIPSVTAEYLNLKSELDIQTKIYGTLREQYELTKIEENDNTQTFQVIEDPEYLKVKSGPPRTRIVMIGILVSFLVSLVVVFFRAYIDNLKQNPIEAEKLNSIIKILHRKKKKS